MYRLIFILYCNSNLQQSTGGLRKRHTLFRRRYFDISKLLENMKNVFLSDTKLKLGVLCDSERILLAVTESKDKCYVNAKLLIGYFVGFR